MKLKLQKELSHKIILTNSLKQQINLLILPSKDLRKIFLELFEDILKDQEIPHTKLKSDIFLDNFTSKNHTLEISQEVNLKDHLLEQLHQNIDQGYQHLIGEYLIDYTEESGILNLELDLNDLSNLIFEEYNFRIKQSDIEIILKELQQMDPIGCCCKSSMESLIIQLLDLQLKKDQEIRIKECIKDLWQGSRKFDELDLNTKNILKKLNPEPGRTIGSNKNIYIKPEVKLTTLNNRWVASIIDPGINNDLIQDFKSSLNQIKSKESREKAKSFLYGLKIRNASLLMVAQFIANYQEKFLNKKNAYLNPLINSEIAENLNFHESSISRILSNKYVQLPDRTMPLKNLTQKGIGKKSDRNQISPQELKEVITKIIKNEKPEKPVSDQALSLLLKEKNNLSIARRTISKYRLQMNIPSSSLRKMNQS